VSARGQESDYLRVALKVIHCAREYTGDKSSDENNNDDNKNSMDKESGEGLVKSTDTTHDDRKEDESKVKHGKYKYTRDT
jgi:hypothetical protein